MRLISKRKIKLYLYYIKNCWKLIFPLRCRETIVVLGMHRSGTSVVAGLLDAAGVSMGKFKQRASKYNKKGYYENILFQKLNIEVLIRSRRSSESRLPDFEKLEKEKKKYRKKAKNLVRIEQEASWGWKDPRTSLLMDMYYRFLVNTKIVICNRDSDDVARSLSRRENMSQKQAREICDFYKNEINKIKKKYKCPMLEINFDDNKKDKDGVVDSIIDFIDISVDETSRDNMINFFDQKLVTSSRRN